MKARGGESVAGNPRIWWRAASVLEKLAGLETLLAAVEKTVRQEKELVQEGLGTVSEAVNSLLQVASQSGKAA